MADRNPDGTFAQGNELWKLSPCFAPGPGAKPKFETPEQLILACQAYFQWVQDNPLQEAGVTQGKLSGDAIPKMRAMTQVGLCLFIGITRETWNTYKTHPQFSDIKAAVDAAIFEQKFTGAAAGLLNHQIIARELGLGDKQSIEINDITEKSEEELLARLRQVMGKQENVEESKNDN